MHLCDDRADCSVCSFVDLKYILPWLDTELVEVSVMLSMLLGHVSLVFHPLTAVGFRGCCWGLQGERCVRPLAGRFLGCLVGRFVSGHSDMCWDPPELYFPDAILEFVEGLNVFRQGVLSRGPFGFLVTEGWPGCR